MTALAANETVELGPAKISMDLQSIGPYNVEKEATSSKDHNYAGYTFTYTVFPASITASNTGNRVLIEVHQLGSTESLDVPISQLNGKTGLEHCVETSDMMPSSKNIQKQSYYVDGHKGTAYIVNRDQKGPIYLAAYSPDIKDGFGKIIIIIGSDFPVDTTKAIFESVTAHPAQEDMMAESNTVLGMGNVSKSNLGASSTGMSSMVQGNMSGQGGMMAMMQSCMAMMQSMGSGNMGSGSMGSGNTGSGNVWDQGNTASQSIMTGMSNTVQGNTAARSTMAGMSNMGQGNTASQSNAAAAQGNKTAAQNGMTGQGGIVQSMIVPSDAGSGSKWGQRNTVDQGNMIDIANLTGKIATLMSAKDPATGIKEIAEIIGIPGIYEHLREIFALLFFGFLGVCLKQNNYLPKCIATNVPSAIIWRDQLKRSFAIAKKDVRIYYSRGPVVIFGLMFPLVLLVAFTIGRNVGIKELFPGIMGMVIFFASTAMGPGILPWETRSRNLERLVSSPIAIWALFLGDMLASFAFGILISIVPLIIAMVMGVKVASFLVLGLGMILATFCFASLGILLSVYPPTDVPATVMMISSLVKFPIIFISGVFVPIGHMHEWGIKMASISPLTYFTDLATYSVTGISYFSVQMDLAVLAFFTIFFLVTSIKLHEKFLPKRLS